MTGFCISFGFFFSKLKKEKRKLFFLFFSKAFKMPFHDFKSLSCCLSLSSRAEDMIFFFLLVFFAALSLDLSDHNTLNQIREIQSQKCFLNIDNDLLILIIQVVEIAYIPHEKIIFIPKLTSNIFFQARPDLRLEMSTSKITVLIAAYYQCLSFLNQKN